MNKLNKSRNELRKIRLKFKKGVDKIWRKWTIIYSLIITVYNIAIFILFYNQQIIALLGFIVGLIFLIYGLTTTYWKCNNLYKRIAEMEKADEKIIKMQEETEKIKNETALICFENIVKFTDGKRWAEEELEKWQELVKCERFRKVSVDLKKRIFINMTNLAKFAEHSKKLAEHSQLILKQSLKKTTTTENERN